MQNMYATMVATSQTKPQFKNPFTLQGLTSRMILLCMSDIEYSDDPCKINYINIFPINVEYSKPKFFREERLHFFWIYMVFFAVYVHYGKWPISPTIRTETKEWLNMQMGVYKFILEQYKYTGSEEDTISVAEITRSFVEAQSFKNYAPRSLLKATFESRINYVRDFFRTGLPELFDEQNDRVKCLKEHFGDENNFDQLYTRLKSKADPTKIYHKIVLLVFVPFLNADKVKMFP